MNSYFQQYGLVLMLAGAAVAVPAGLLIVSWLLGRVGVRPRRPNAVKSDTYESGMTPIGDPRWTGFNIRFYMYALAFVLFDVEVVFVYPWAVQFRALGLFALIEMMAFVGILAVGYLYMWRKGDLEWM